MAEILLNQEDELVTVEDSTSEDEEADIWINIDTIVT